VVFSKADDVPVDAPTVNTPSDTEQGGSVDTPVEIPPVTDVGSGVMLFYAPVSGQVTRAAALETLTYMPSLNIWKTHSGVDFAAAEGEAVMAVADGTVVSVEQTTLEGVVVTVSHDGGLTSVYKSLASASVKAGDTVSGGGTQVGTAGTMLVEGSDGVHLHLEMAVNGQLVNPLDYLESEILK
jgi:murein DD-endopeptidase MepM/ murein hydrolase activator NlpD